MIAENLLETLPLMFQTKGIESHVTNAHHVVKNDRFAKAVELTTPEKTRQRFKSRKLEMDGSLQICENGHQDENVDQRQQNMHA